MKKYHSVIIGLVLISLWSCNKEYTITGEISGVENGTGISLVPFANYEVHPEQATTVVDGNFIFNGQVPEPREYYLVLDEQAYYRLMVENSRISIKARVIKQSDNYGKESFIFDDVVVKGSSSNKYLYSQLAIKDELNELYKNKNERFADIQAMLGKARMENNKAQMDSLTMLPRYKELVDAENMFFSEVKKKYNAVFEANLDTFWGPLLMLNLYNYLTPDIKPTFEKMSEEARNSFYGKMVAEKLYPANKAGEKVPGFTVKDSEGKSITLDQLIKDKKVVLIDFWASWCGPCNKEIPNLKENYDRFASKGFEILSFSIDKDPEAWKNKVNEKELNWPNFNDLSVSSLYKVTAVPTTYLIDGNGILIAENIKGEELSEKLEDLLEEVK